MKYIFLYCYDNSLVLGTGLGPVATQIGSYRGAEGKGGEGRECVPLSERERLSSSSFFMFSSCSIMSLLLSSLSLSLLDTQRHTETDRDTQADRQRHTDTHTETDRQRQTDRDTQTHTQRQTVRPRDLLNHLGCQD